MNRIELAEHRYRLLVEQLRREDDRYGWKTRVGGLLGIASQHIGMIERGERKAGKDAVGRALQRLRLDPDFFYAGSEGDDLDYRDFIGRRRDEEPPPEAWGQFLTLYEGSIQPPLTDDDRSWLLEVRHHRVTPESYLAALSIKRGGMSPAVAEESARVTGDAAKRGAGLGVKRRRR